MNTSSSVKLVCALPLYAMLASRAVGAIEFAEDPGAASGIAVVVVFIVVLLVFALVFGWCTTCALPAISVSLPATAMAHEQVATSPSRPMHHQLSASAQVNV